jgi:outer membrane protein TolC
MALAALATLLAACSRSHYERAADREVYQIIQQAEQQVFGSTNSFSIRTRFSERTPTEITPNDVLGDRSATNRRVLNLEDSLQLAVLNSREFQTQKEQLYLTALSLTGARYEFSPQFFADSTAQASGIIGGAESGSVRSRVGVSQYLRTGGRLSVSLANDLLRYFTGWSTSGQSSRDSAINTLSVSLSQPILRGFGRNDPAVENLTQAERNVIYAIRSFSQFQRTFDVQVAGDFFQLLSQKDQVRNNYTNYLRRAENTLYLEARAVDRVRRDQVDDARNSELAARITYINSVAAFLDGLDAFKLRLGLPITEEIYLEDQDIVDLALVGLIPVDIDRDAAFRLAVAEHLDLLNAIDRFEDSQRRLGVVADQLKPGILLSSSAAVSSDPPYDYARFNFDEVRYNVGLSLDLPVDRLRERNNYRAALVSFESQIRTLSQTLDNFRDRIDGGLRTLEQRRLNYLNSEAALEVARRRVDLTTAQFEGGRVPIRDVREAQDALISAQNSLIAVQISYFRTRLDLLLDIGILQTDLPAFWLRDPLADRLTPELRGTTPLSMPSNELIPPNRFLDPPS